MCRAISYSMAFATKRTLFKFLISHRVPKVELFLRLTEMLTSQRIEPCSIVRMAITTASRRFHRKRDTI